MTIAHIVVAIVLLVGVVVTAYGYFAHDRISLFIGVLVIIAGVLNGIVRILSHEEPRGPGEDCT